MQRGTRVVREDRKTAWPTSHLSGSSRRRRDYRAGMIGDTEMAKRSIETRAQDLLALTRRLADSAGLTWVEANNVVYGPGGAFTRLFPSAKERLAFAKTEESRQIDRLIDGLPEPPVGPQRREYSGKFNVR